MDKRVTPTDANIGTEEMHLYLLEQNVTVGTEEMHLYFLRQNVRSSMVPL